jgi:hemoglobin
MATTLFEKLGGQSAVDAAVDIFYRKVLSDDSISHFFENIDMDAQIAKQKAFLTFAFGGPNNYSGQDMRNAHSKLVKEGLNEQHFNAVAGHLQSTLEELGVSADLVQEVMTIAGSTKNDVLNR